MVNMMTMDKVLHTSTGWGEENLQTVPKMTPIDTNQTALILQL